MQVSCHVRPTEWPLHELGEKLEPMICKVKAVEHTDIMHGAHLDAGLCGSAQPVAVGGEAQSMDDITSIQTVQPLALCQIPQHGNTVLQPPHTT